MHARACFSSIQNARSNQSSLYTCQSVLNLLARLVSAQFPATAGRCLSFWCHMYGSSTGTLNVYIMDKDGKSTLVWSKSGDQGDKWIQAKVSFISNSEYKVRSGESTRSVTNSGCPNSAQALKTSYGLAHHYCHKYIFFPPYSDTVCTCFCVSAFFCLLVGIVAEPEGIREGSGTAKIDQERGAKVSGNFKQTMSFILFPK